MVEAAMRGLALATCLLPLVVSCTLGPLAPKANPSASPAATAGPSPVASVTPSATNFGLMVAGGFVQTIRTDGAVVASARAAPPTVQACSAAAGSPLLQPPASATADHVYVRNGDTRIETGSPEGTLVTTVPGGPKTVSFFSVSPDDKRIAVVVEDLSPADTIRLRLYVEDLRGHGHHLDIYSTTILKRNGRTLWPMGWHLGSLVLAVMPACVLVPGEFSPYEWHVSNASTAVRIATIGKTGCIPSYWPSPAGVACVDVGTQQADIYDWSGKIASHILIEGGNGFQSGISPSGVSIFFTPRVGIGAPPAATSISFPGPLLSVSAHAACLWIDDEHLLAPDAVIALSRNPQGYLVSPLVTRLPAGGQCAGRIPGGL